VVEVMEQFQELMEHFQLVVEEEVLFILHLMDQDL
jgi:hypothetical protein